MPAKRLSMRNTREILRLRWGLKRSLRDTGLSCGVVPSTVHDVVARATAAGLSWPLPGDLDDAALEARLYPPPSSRRDRAVPNFEHLYRELKRRGVTLELLWQEYREQYGAEGYGYSRFCDLYRDWREELDVVMRQEHLAGEKLFVDFAGMTMEVIDQSTGEVSECPIFVAALGASSFTYAEACEGQDKPSWIEANIHAYEYIAGVPTITVPDNLKAAVTRPDLYEPDLNPAYSGGVRVFLAPVAVQYERLCRHRVRKLTLAAVRIRQSNPVSSNTYLVGCCAAASRSSKTIVTRVGTPVAPGGRKLANSLL